MINYNITDEENEYAAYKLQKHYCEVELMNNYYLQFISEMILCGRVQINELSFELRTYNRGFYVAAFRVSRNISSEAFNNVRKLLQEDLHKDFANKNEFQRLLDLNVEWDDYFGR